VLRHLERVTDRERKRLYLEMLSSIYGTAFLMPYWDKSKHTQVAIQQPNPLFGTSEDQPQYILQAEDYQGDFDFEVLDVWQVFPQPVQWWDQVEWCVVARTRSLEWVRTTFGEIGWSVSSDSGQSADLFASMEKGALTPTMPGSQQNDAVSDEDTVRVLEYFEKPGAQFPEGRYVVIANGVLLHEEDMLPHPKRRFPIIPYYGRFVPGRLWGKGWPEDLVDQQRELNKVESQIIENKNMCGRPKWAVDRKAGLDDDALHSGPGEIVEYDGDKGKPPVQIAPVPLPAYVSGMPEQIIDRMRNISGVHEVSSGAGVPGGVSSGVAIDLLQQQDDSRLSIPNIFAGQAFREMDQQALEMVQVSYTEPRLVRTFGKDQEDEAMAFMGTDLRGNTEVGLEASEGVSDSVAALRQRCLDYQSAGFFNMELEMQVSLFTIMGENQLAEDAEKRLRAQAETLAAKEQELAQREQAVTEQEGAVHDALGGVAEQAGAVAKQQDEHAKAQLAALAPQEPQGALQPLQAGM
jgi:hypothetical protein